jgi:cytochrome c5
VRAGDLIPPISSGEFLKTRDDVTLRNIISQGQPDLGMNPFGSAYGGQLSDEQIDAIIAFMRVWETNPPPAEAPAAPTEAPAQPQAPSGPVTFSGQVLPILQAKCQMCHNGAIKLGGWDASSYQTVMESGEHPPVIVGGDAQNSLLAQFLQGTNGKFMPPTGALPQNEIQAILDWIAAGAEDN